MIKNIIDLVTSKKVLPPSASEKIDYVSIAKQVNMILFLVSDDLQKDIINSNQDNLQIYQTHSKEELKKLILDLNNPVILFEYECVKDETPREFVKEIRNDWPGVELHMISYVHLIDREKMTSLLRQRLNGFLVKPYRYQNLLKLLAQFQYDPNDVHI